MDRSAKEITFDEKGVCNFCAIAQRELAWAKTLNPEDLKKIRGKRYDCLIGLSGGVDSSYLLHKAVEMGLRPLCFSVDNGYNEAKADENIMRLVETLKVPFIRVVLDLAQFRDLQSAFIKAGLVNIEIPTDHVLMAVSYATASKYDIKYILSGGNVATESIMPASWSYTARDLVHIKDVYRKMKGRPLKGLPVCSLLLWNYYRWVKGIKTLYLLDYLGYNKADAVKLLSEKYGFQDYHEKHCENTFTWWYQNYYLFEKFGIDKRKAHLSSLINSGQMTRAEAMDLLSARPVYPALGIEKKVLTFPKRSHYDFKTDEKWYRLISKIVKTFQWKS